MPTFTSVPSYVYAEEISYTTKIIKMEDGGEVRNSYGSPRRLFTLYFDRVTPTIKTTIHDFYVSRYGQYEAFSWVNPNDGVTYSVRFVDASLIIKESDYQMYTIKVQLIEAT